MHLSGLLRTLERDPALAAAVSESERPLTIEVRDALKPAVVALLARRGNRPVIVISADDARARDLAQEVAAWAPEHPVVHFADPDQPAYSMLAISNEVLAQRVAALAHLTRASSDRVGAAPVITASASALMRRLLPPAEFRSRFLTLAPGVEVDPATMTTRLVALGFERTPLVERPGEFARRGGIVDVFSPDAQAPVRVDFLGDEIESVRSFDPATQRSLGPSPLVTLTPATEVPIWMGRQLAGQLREIELASLRPEDRQTWQRHLEHLDGNEYFDDAAFYTMSLMPSAASLFDFAPNALRVVDELGQTAWAVGDAEKHAARNRARLLASGELPEAFASPLIPGAEILAACERAEVRLTFVPGLPDMERGTRVVAQGFEAVPATRDGCGAWPTIWISFAGMDGAS